MISDERNILISIKDNYGDNPFNILNRYFNIKLKLSLLEESLNPSYVYEKYYLKNPELKKNVDKLFKLLSPKINDKKLSDLNIALSKISLRSLLNDSQKQQLLNAVEITLIILYILFLKFRQKEIVQKMLSIMSEKKKFIIWGKEDNNTIDVVTIFLECDFYNVEHIINAIKTTKIFSKSGQKSKRYYTKKNNGKYLNGFNAKNKDAEQNFNVLNKNLYEIKTPSNISVSEKNCYWCSPLNAKDRTQFRCARCEEVYKKLASLNNNTSRYKRPNEISQHIIRNLKNPKNKNKKFIDIIFEELERIYNTPKTSTKEAFFKRRDIVEYKKYIEEKYALNN